MNFAPTTPTSASACTPSPSQAPLVLLPAPVGRVPDHLHPLRAGTLPRHCSLQSPGPAAPDAHQTTARALAQPIPGREAGHGDNAALAWARLTDGGHQEPLPLPELAF